MDVIKVRAAADQLSAELQKLTAAPAVLTSAWSQLESLLELGPPAALRDCPACGGAVVREATLCRFCWSKLVPPAPAARSAAAANS